MFENPASDFERYVNGVPPRPDHREHRNDIWWISAAVLSELRNQ
jgi:hypothetical protein